MPLRINTNIAALKSLNNLQDSDRKLAESLQRISSGFRINKAADDPAGLIVSEQLRGQIVGLNQAIANSEVATAMVQTAEAALDQVNTLLIRSRQLALQAGNEGASDPAALEANQLELDDALETIQRVAQTTRFGNRRLLDGSGGVTGEALGEGLTFISATVRTRSSPVEGFPVVVERVPTRATLEGSEPLDEDNVPGLQVTLLEGGRSLQATARPNDTPRSFLGRLRRTVEEAGLNLEVMLTGDDTLRVVQREFGSEHTFQGGSSVSGVLSEQAGALQAAVPGQDVAGTIAGEAAQGRGRLLTGLPGNENTEGLAVRVEGPRMVVGHGPRGEPIVERVPQEGPAGVVNVSNNALDFQVGPNAGQRIALALPQVAPRFLARGVENRSGFGSLAEARIDRPERARDAIRLIDAAIDELTLKRGKLGAFQKNALESNIATLRVTAENLMAAESTIRDANLARELTELTRNKLLFEAGTAAVAEANRLPRNVLDLLK